MRLQFRRGSETIYYDLVPEAEAKTPTSLRRFLDRVAAAGVPIVDLVTPFAAARRAGGDPLFLPDDMHWSPRAVRIAADKLAELLGQ